MGRAMTQTTPVNIGRSGVGNDLRLAREQLGWTLPAVAAHLRIRLPYLEAIEEGRNGDLPGNAYAVGFLRTYARALGLDADEIARRFKAEAADVNRKTELSFPAPVPERGVPAGAAVLLGAIIVVVAYIGWYRLSGERHAVQDAVPPVPDRLAPLAMAAKDEPPAPPQSTSSPSATVAILTPSPTPSGTLSSTPAKPGAPAAPGATAATATAPAATPGKPGAPGAPPATATASNAAPAAPPAAPLPPAADGGRLVLRAKADSWMQVRDAASGTIVLNRTLKAGETWPVPNRPGLLLTVGNAGGTEVLLDGQPSAGLGAEGAVRKDLPLDLAQVRDGKLAPAAPPAPKPATPPAPKPAQP